MGRDEGLAFGEAAELYDRSRPGYPEPLFDDVLEAVPGATRVLEAGAGTGHVTAALAARGVAVEAIEPDPRMAAVARRRCAGLPVRVLERRFEDWDGDAGSFEVVACGQAWHWIEPARGAAVAAAALRPGGALAVWWNRPRAVAGGTLDAVRRVYAAEAPELLDTTSLLDVQPGVDVPAPLPGFGPWRTRTYPWTAMWDGAGYSDLLRTQGDHLLLPEGRRERLLHAVAGAIAATGDRIEYTFGADLSIASPARA